MTRKVHSRFSVVMAFLWFLACVLHPGCDSRESGKATSIEEGEKDDHQYEEMVVHVSEQELREFGIEERTAGPGKIYIYVSFPGEIRANADRLAHIVPRYAGIVTEVGKRIGDLVSTGDVLAVIESDSLASYELKTLIDGTVIAKHITQGEAVSRQNETFVIADLSTVWVDLSIYQRDVARVRVGQPVTISPGHGLPEASATISYVAPVVNQETRTATARLVLPNPEGIWRLGMFVTGRVLVEETQVSVAVPRTALQTMHEETVLFIKIEDGFRAEPVTLGRSGETHVEILSGLRAGERYVARGGFTLKAELSKGAFGDGHTH